MQDNIILYNKALFELSKFKHKAWRYKYILTE